MSAMIDISKHIKVPTALKGAVVSFDRAPDAQHIAEIAGQATAKHADSAICRSNANAALWRNHADALKLGPVQQAWSRAFLHADSGSDLPALALRSQLGADIYQPTQDFADLLDTIAVRAVAGEQISYWRNFIRLTSGGGVVTVAGDQTTFNTVGYKHSQELRPLHMCGIAVARGWMEQRQTAAAGINDVANKMMALRQAFREYFFELRLNGISGLDCYAIQTLPGLLRWSSPYVLGTATITQAQQILLEAITKAAELSAANLKPDTAIITDRIMYRLMGTTALPYTPTNSYDQFLIQLRQLGINRLVSGKSLRNIGGTNVDGMLLVRNGGNDGMAYVQGLDAAPVWTYQDSGGETTIYASSFGDVEQPVAEGSLLAEFEVTP